MSQSRTTGRNREQYVAVVAMRLSSKAGAHDSRPNRQRTRGNAKRASLKEW